MQNSKLITILFKFWLFLFLFFVVLESKSIPSLQTIDRPDEVTYLREQVALMSKVNLVELEKEHELQLDINEANCRILELMNAQKIKDNECRSLREEKDKYWSQLVYCMREKSDGVALISHLHQDIAAKEIENNRILTSFEVENQRLQDLLDEEKIKSATLAQTVANSFQRNKSLQEDLDKKNTELLSAYKEIESLSQKLFMRDQHVEQLTKAYEKLYREQNNHVTKEKKRQSIGSLPGCPIDTNSASVNNFGVKIVSHNRSDSTDSVLSTASTLSVLVSAKEADPDKEALTLGMLLSQQMKEFGTTMFDSLRPSDEEALDSYRMGGFTREEAALLLFEERYGKVSTQSPALHPALPRTRLSLQQQQQQQQMVMSNCEQPAGSSRISTSFRSPTKIEQLLSGLKLNSATSAAPLPLPPHNTFASGSMNNAQRPSDNFRSAYGVAEQLQFQQQHHQQQQPGARIVQFARSVPADEDGRLTIPVVASKGHRNWSSTSDINLGPSLRR